jgi:F-type H+-transporting ATPase subunit b
MYGLIIAAEAAPGAENGYLLPHDINEFWWGLAAFIGIMSLLIWKVLPIAKKGLAGRSEKIAAQLDQAAAQKQSADAEVAALKASLSNADEESARIVADARRRADQMQADLKAKADADVAEAKQRTHIEIEASKQQAFADLQAEVAAMTFTATQAVVTENLTDAVKTDLIEQFITQLGAAR